MSSLHLECGPRSLHIQHLLKVLLRVVVLARCDAGAVGLRREKDIICGVEQKIKTNIDFFFLFSISEERSIAIEFQKESFHLIYEAEYWEQFAPRVFTACLSLSVLRL